MILAVFTLNSLGELKTRGERREGVTHVNPLLSVFFYHISRLPLMLSPRFALLTLQVKKKEGGTKGEVVVGEKKSARGEKGKERGEDKSGRNERITGKLESDGLRGSLWRWEDNFKEHREQAEPPAAAVM